MERNKGGNPELLAAGREFLKSPFGDPAKAYESDQMKEMPMPPMAKEAAGGTLVTLTRDFVPLVTQPDFITLLEERMSHRNFQRQAMTLEQLSLLLWATQGVTGIRGEGYGTFRTYPSGGARHAMELYITAHNVGGLPRGVYHYLPLSHQLELVREAPEDFEDAVSYMLCDQAWCKKAGAVFFFSAVPYRAEWRYCTSAHRVMLIDAGHSMQNLYLGCHAAGLGACAIAAFRQTACDTMLGLDGEEEFTLYAAPVGTVVPPKQKRSFAPGLSFEPSTGEE